MSRAAFISSEDIRPLARRSNAWGLWLTIHCWGVIALAMAVAIVFPHPVVVLVMMAIIGSRQLGLSILMHEAAHNTLFASRALNDGVGHWVLSVPWGGDLAAYRTYHLKHHAHTQSDADPDLYLSAKFPVTRTSLLRKFARDISGVTGVKLRFYQFMSLFRDDGPSIGSTLAFYGVNLVAFGVFAAFGMAWVYLVLWLLPLLTWYQLVLRIRNIAEHAMTTRDGNVLTTARTTRANWLARAFLAPYWVNYHVEHHAYMYVPCYRLRGAHQRMRAQAMTFEPGYAAVLRKVVTNGLPLQREVR